MEGRLIIAYSLIALMVLAGIALIVVVMRNRRRHRRRMRGIRD